MKPSRFLLAGLAVSAAGVLSAKIVTRPVAYEHAGVKLWTLDLVAIRKLNNAGVEIPGVKRVVEKVRATRGF